MKSLYSAVCTGLALTVLCCGWASGQVSLGTASNFAVLGGSTVTNIGPTVVTGDLGVSPGSALTGFPPGILIGSQHLADAVAAQAQNDANTAYNLLAGTACNTNLTGQDLGGLTLAPGVYCFASSAQLTGALTLDALGDANAVWIFQMGSTITTASNSSVTVINGGSDCNVFWQVGSSATLGTGTTFVGNILALASITLTTGTNVSGRSIALNGAVTMDSNHVTGCNCVGAPLVTDLGPGCGNPSAPLLAITPPRLGQAGTVTVTSVFPMAMVKVFVSECGATPFILGTSCSVYVDLASLQMVLMGMTDSSGAWTSPFTVPQDPLLLGHCFVIQALVWTATGPLAGDNLTNGLQVTIGCK